MKYRAAATQIKEIPIIFRGTIDAAAAGAVQLFSDPELYYGQDPDTGSITAYIEDFNCFDEQDISIDFNGTLYKNLPRYEHGSAAYFGYDPFSEDEPDYPFSLETAEDNDYSYLYLRELPTTDNVSLTVWAGDPEESGTDGKKLFSADLTGNGQIKRFHCRFALGENGTLHIRPYIILNGNIRVDLCAFASNGDNYISGDNEEIAFDCYVPVETHAIAYVEAENVGEYESILDAAMVVQYEDYIEPESIIGYEGINLRRGK